MNKFEVLKGTKDYEAEEMVIINSILKIIQNNFEKYGFLPFDTPIIEYMETLTNKYEEDAEIVGEIFKVKDRGNRNLGLRYDLTVPLCRYIAGKKQIKLPFKRYAIGKVFRDGPIKKGRSREFIQCDADIIGVKGRGIEAETLEMFYNTYKELNINAILEINNNKILRGVLLENGFEKKDLSNIILSVDKLKKIGEEAVLEEILQKGFDINKIKKVIEIYKFNNLENLSKIAKNEILKEGINELKELCLYLDKLSIEYRINFSMARGLDIYTGNIWEVYEKENKISSSLGSGGRYDKAIGNYLDEEKEYPAIGVSFGLVPISFCINKKEEKLISEILIAILEEDNLELYLNAFKLANKYRKENINTEILYTNKLKKAFEYCDYMKIEKIIAIGKKDFEKKEAILKNLKTKIEEKISL